MSLLDHDPVVKLVEETGDLAGFAGRAIVATLGTGRYLSEVMRQCAILVTGTTLVVVGLVFVMGGECGLFAGYALRPIGAGAFAGYFTSFCGLHEMWPYMFGYIFSAKVGCGLVAEIGSMRISEELDALSVMGINPMRYIVGTRLLAVWLVVPAMYVVAMVAGTVGSYLMVVSVLKVVSFGQWVSLQFSSQSLPDNLFSLMKTFIYATFITLVATYYGFTAKNGSVGVGTAVARSMIVNLLLIHLSGSVLTALLYADPQKQAIGG